MVLTTPLKTALIQCTEVSPNFSDEPVPDSEVLRNEHRLKIFTGTHSFTQAN